MRQTKTARLDALLKTRGAPGDGGLYVEFRPFRGWWLMHDEIRWFEDDGDYLGANYDEAVKWLKRLGFNET